MPEVKMQKTADPLAALPSAKEIMEQIALKEAEKASAAMRELSAADAEKKALIEKFSKKSGVSDEERMARAAAHRSRDRTLPQRAVHRSRARYQST
jgi:hypothetical protein